VYGRRAGEQVLTLEASGALEQASLVMRDRETDSWWSLMESAAIGGPLDGTRLEELPVSEKTTWGAWRAAHPETLVLSVDGREHDETDPYANYFTSDGTFRGMAVADDRLPAKEAVYAFHLDGEAWAVPHAAFEGGAEFPLPDGRVVELRRPEGASIFASSEAWLVEGDGERKRLGGFDTYWYTWVGVNEGSGLLR